MYRTLCFLFISLLFMNFSTADERILLYAGTPVSLVLNQEISSENATRGDIVDFMVRSNVTINGQVVIAAGSIAEGVVKEVKHSCWSCAYEDPKLVLSVESVQAVDGQRIYLRSIPHKVVGNARKRKAAIANIGRAVSARVLNNVRIDA